MTPIDLLIIGILVLISGASTGSEAALFSLDPADRDRITARGGRAAAAVLFLLERPRRLLTTILFVNMAVNTALIARIESIAEAGLGAASLPVAAGLSTVLLLVEEVTAQRFAIGYRERFAAAAALPLRLIYGLLRPLVDLFGWLTTRAVRTVKGFGVVETVTEEEILSAVEEAARNGSLDAPQGRLIRGVLGLDELRAANLMVSREKIVGLPKETDGATLREAVRRTGFTRFPVYSGSIDNIIGIIYAKDLLPSIVEGAAPAAAQVLRPVTYVPKWRKGDDLLRELQKRKVHIAIVVDEFGATAGLVTLEDVITAIAGKADEARTLREAKG